MLPITGRNFIQIQGQPRVMQIGSAFTRSRIPAKTATACRNLPNRPVLLWVIVQLPSIRGWCRSSRQTLLFSSEKLQPVNFSCRRSGFPFQRGLKPFGVSSVETVASRCAVFFLSSSFIVGQRAVATNFFALEDADLDFRGLCLPMSLCSSRQVLNLRVR